MYESNVLLRESNATRAGFLNTLHLNVTIRRTLLLAFLIVGLVPAIVLTILAFTRTRDALRAEIEQGLQVQAHTIAADLDKILFERLQNVVTWNHLEVMQDIHVGDVDRRVSTFLAEMKLRYGGVYVELHATDKTGRIIASSAPAALGVLQAQLPAWLTTTLPGGTVHLSMPQRISDGRAVLTIRTSIISQFTDAPLGELVALMDWTAVDRMIDSAAQQRRRLLVADREGHVISASTALRTLSMYTQRLDQDWLQSPPGHIVERDAAPFGIGPVIVGHAVSPGYDHFSGFGWTTLVLQPVAEALQPVRRMAYTFLGLLIAAMLVIIVVAGLVSARIAKPVVALTDYTRRFKLEQSGGVPPQASGEVGELTQAFTQMVDDLGRSRQTLVQASKLAAVGEFAAVMAHEIRTPLGILRSSAQMLERDPATTPEARELLGFVSTETQRLSRLVTAMLDHARARPPVRTAQNVEALAEHCLAMLTHQAQKQNVKLLRDFRSTDPVVEADGEQLTQVFLNLLMNALQILPEGGSAGIRSHNDSGRLIIEIFDNGPGVPSSERNRIFEPFVYRREGGLGLGLAVVKQIVNAHDGDIVVDENAGGGACFRIRLPQSTSQIA